MPGSLTSEPSLCQTDALSEFRWRVPPKVMWKMRIDGLHDHDYTPSSWLRDLRGRPNNRPCRFLSRQLFSIPETPDDGSPSGDDSSCSFVTEDKSDDLSRDSDPAEKLPSAPGGYKTGTVGPGQDTDTSLGGHVSKSPQLIFTKSSRMSSGHRTHSAASHRRPTPGTADVAQVVAAPSPMSFLDVSTGAVTYDKPRVDQLKARNCSSKRTEIDSTDPAYSFPTPYSTVESKRFAQDRNLTAYLSSSGNCRAKGNGSAWQQAMVTGSRKRVATAVDGVEKSTESLDRDTRATKRRRIQEWLEETDTRYTRQNDA
ncbi:uncharacterized protein LOC144880118 [Branchiostoma floridae x Branchiostoma japonicum]